MQTPTIARSPCRPTGSGPNGSRTSRPAPSRDGTRPGETRCRRRAGTAADNERILRRPSRAGPTIRGRPSGHALPIRARTLVRGVIAARRRIADGDQRQTGECQDQSRAAQPLPLPRSMLSDGHERFLTSDRMRTCTGHRPGMASPANVACRIPAGEKWDAGTAGRPERWQPG